jgi:hypothetical protein
MLVGAIGKNRSCDMRIGAVQVIIFHREGWRDHLGRLVRLQERIRADTRYEGRRIRRWDGW